MEESRAPRCCFPNSLSAEYQLSWPSLGANNLLWAGMDESRASRCCFPEEFVSKISALLIQSGTKEALERAMVDMVGPKVELEIKCYILASPRYDDLLALNWRVPWLSMP